MKLLTQEEIKKSYRKLAQKWHPDKWSGEKDLEKKKQANEKMRKLNRAYEILGDPELRKRYDLGETEFTDYNKNYNEYDEKIRRKEEEIRLMEELLKGKKQTAEILEKIWLLNAKHLDRSMTTTDIGSAFCFTLPRVREEDLDPALWQPYQDWEEKVWEMEITISEGKDRSEELKNFKEEMIKAIKETETALKIREENEKIDRENRERQNQGDRVNSQLNQTRTDSFKYIEKEMSEKGLKSQDLGQYSNYKEQINSLDKVYKIRDLREEVLSAISKLDKKREDDYPPRPNPDSPKPEKPNKHDKPKKQVEDDKIDNFVSGIRDNKYDNWTHEELINEIKREQLNNSSLQKLISVAEIRIRELEEEIRELKAELPQTPKTRQGIFRREKQLNQWKQSKDALSNTIDNNNNPLPILPIIGLISVIALLGLITYKIKKNKLKH